MSTTNRKSSLQMTTPNDCPLLLQCLEYAMLIVISNAHFSEHWSLNLALLSQPVRWPDHSQQRKRC